MNNNMLNNLLNIKPNIGNELILKKAMIKGIIGVTVDGEPDKKYLPESKLSPSLKYVNSSPNKGRNKFLSKEIKLITIINTEILLPFNLFLIFIYKKFSEFYNEYIKLNRIILTTTHNKI